MKNSKKGTQLPISVLNLPPRNQLISAPSPSSEYELYHVAGKKMCIEASITTVPKAKLFSNLEIYEWRNQTEFPIAKTRFITIQPNYLQSTNSIELTVYNEHCPLKLNRMYEMTLAQTLYMLKESVIGFQRLFNRFGPFEVKESMIAINERGFCRVWINQNFAVNVFGKQAESQAKMMEQIQEIMERHCQESKASKKLFAKLRQCRTFLGALKEIDILAMASKMLVPTKFLMTPSSCREIGKSDNIHNLLKTQSVSQQNIRYSIVSGKTKAAKTEEAKDDNTVVNYSVSGSPISASNPSAQSSPTEIKRFKSLERLKVANLMKISDGETAYSRNYKETKCSNFGNSPRETTAQKMMKEEPKKKQRKWLEDSSFVMELQDDKKVKREQKEKKEMSYSTDIVIKVQQPKEPKDRKFSANIGNPSNDSLFYRFHGARDNQRDAYTNQFSYILDNDHKQESSICTPRNRIVQQVDQQKFKDQHTQAIIKNNGWNKISGFLVSTPQDQLNQSFHEGQEENNLNREFKLHKLDSIGKRPVAMSIMPAQYEDII